jgi:glycosyltransferase involved in cell wall biosynthesis
MIRLALVVPRYGPTVLGGAETLARQIAHHLPRTEFDLTVLTTCARDLVTWRNEYPPGETHLEGVRVLRFPIDHKRRDVRVFRLLSGRADRWEPLSPADQAAWLDHNVHSPEMYRYLMHRGDDYDLFLFMPYVFGITLYGSAVWPEKSIVCPCLHDEAYAYFEDVRLMLSSVRGLMFISSPEQTLAEEKLGVRHPLARLVGFGLDDLCADAERFRRKFGLPGPFLLFAGRREPAKNIPELVSHFLAYRRARPDRDLKLVVAGSGPLTLPGHPDIVSLGYLDRQDLVDAYAAATVLCQPSLVESFSIVLMEAWLAGTPVLVHGQCPVTRHHVLASNGGLYFTSAAEFAGAVDWFFENPEERQRMAVLGRAYARRAFSWPAVLGRFRESVARWRGFGPG